MDSAINLVPLVVGVGARHAADAAGGVHLVASVRVDQRLVPGSDDSARGDDRPPVLHYSGVWPNPVMYLIPTQGPMLLFGAAFDQVTLAPWQVLYAVVYPIAVRGGAVLGGQGHVRPLRRRAVGRHVMAISATLHTKALAAFGRNDIRGTYRDPLLVMIVLAPGHLDHRGRGPHAAVHRDAR